MKSNLSFDEFANQVRSSDLFTMRHPSTPGLDVREGYEMMCVGDPIICKNRYTGLEEVVVPVLYSDNIPYYTGSVRGLRKANTIGFLFSITTQNGEAS